MQLYWSSSHKNILIKLFGSLFSNTNQNFEIIFKGV